LPIEKQSSSTSPTSPQKQKEILTDGFPTASGRGKFVPAEFIHADELPDELSAGIHSLPGRQLEHWHTGSMPRYSPILDAIEPDPVVSIHPENLKTMLGCKKRATQP
jgi:formate dehydrogenase major subunit